MNKGMKYRYFYEELRQSKNILATFRMYHLNPDGKTGQIYPKYRGYMTGILSKRIASD